MSDLASEVSRTIRDIPDFPKPGILFKDITPVLAHPALFERVCAAMSEGWGPIDAIVGIESRGFIFGAAMVRHTGAGFVPARKKGKLPYATVSVEYALEYGHSALELHADALGHGQRVLIVDDLLATGGTASAAIELVRKLGGVVVGASFCVELSFLDGRQRLDVPVRSVVRF